MNSLVKVLLYALGGFIALEVYNSQKTGRSFNIGNVPLVGQIMYPQIAPVADTDASYAGVDSISMADALSAIDANPSLVADITPQGQFRIDTRATG